MYQVLFLCTGNSARSILAEAILTARGAPVYRGHSAGSYPKAGPHPEALRRLEAEGIPTDGLSSKSWDVFAEAGSPGLDLVVTVCDAAAGETCPIYPGAPLTVHWGLPDPAAAEEADLSRAFKDAFDALDTRIGALLALDPARRADSPDDLRRNLARIHETA